MKIFAVMPAFNERNRILPVVNRVCNFVDKVIVIDDCSNDKTFSIIPNNKKCTCIRLTANMGAGFATRVGCDIAINNHADIIVTIDADGQHKPEEIPRLTKKLINSQVDIVFGSRVRNTNMPTYKKLGNFLLSYLANIIFNINITDSQTGFHAFTASTYKKIRWSSDRYGVVSEFVARTALQKLRYSEVTTSTIYNDKKSGMGIVDALDAALSMIKWRIVGV